MSTLWETQLNSQEVEAYKQFFQAAAKSQPNVVTGIEAVQFFAKSGLSNTLLSEVSFFYLFFFFLLFKNIQTKNEETYTCIIKRYGKQQMKKISAILHKILLLLHLNLLLALKTTLKQLNHYFLQVKKRKKKKKSFTRV